MRKILFISFLLLGLVSLAEAQVSVGINFQTSDTFITVGTDPDKEFFGEARLGIAHDLGLELMGAYNFTRKSEVNGYVGLGLGILGNHHRHHHRHHHHHNNDLYLAIPVGALIKPFNSTKNLGILIEAAPVFTNYDHNYLRAWIGVKYTFR